MSIVTGRTLFLCLFSNFQEKDLITSSIRAFWCLLKSGCVQTHKDLVDGVVALAREVQQDQVLANLIRRKFAIKCTTGYSLNALVDFHTDDPIEMIKRLIIGSEGTFGFVSQATYNTVPEWPDKVRTSEFFTLKLCAVLTV